MRRASVGDLGPLFDGHAPMRVRGMAFREPWASAVIRPVPAGATAPYPKNIDNRSVGPGSMVAGLLVIRTSREYDPEGERWLRETYGYPWTEKDRLAPGLLVGVARVDRAIFSGAHPWYFGPAYRGKSNVGWALENLAVLDDPIPYTPRCGLGLFALPDDLAERVRAIYHAGMEDRR